MEREERAAGAASDEGSVNSATEFGLNPGGVR